MTSQHVIVEPSVGDVTSDNNKVRGDGLHNVIAKPPEILNTFRNEMREMKVRG